MYDFITLAYKKHKEALKMLTEVLKINTVLDKYDPKSDAPFGIGNKECLELFSRYAEKDGFIYKNVDNYAMHIEIGEGEELLGILGHLDVVPATGNWDSDPFNPVIKNNKVYARGALDDKGPVVCAYYALKILKELNVKFNKRVRLILGSDEESESRCLNYYFKKEEMPSLGFSPDAEFPLIYGEKAMQFFTVYGELDEDSIIESFTSGDRVNIVPDYCEVVLKKNVEREFSEYLIRNNYKGKVIGNKYIVEGKSSHGSMPENGVNAAFIMIEFINMIEPCNFTRFVCDYLSFDTYGKKLNIDIKTNDMGSLTINPGVFNISKNKFSIEVDCRIPSDNMFDTIKNRLNKACSEYSGISYKLSKPKYMHYVDPDSELVKTLYKSYTDITGDYENKPYTIGGGTYAKFIPNCVAFGPCFPNEESKIHEPNEYISIETFIKNIAIYAKSIYELVK